MLFFLVIKNKSKSSIILNEKIEMEMFLKRKGESKKLELILNIYTHKLNIKRVINC